MTKNNTHKETMNMTDWRGLCDQLIALVERCPSPALAVEVAELVRLLRLDAELERGDGMPQAAARFDRAAELLEQLNTAQTPQPVPDCERNWDSILSPSGGYEMNTDAALRDGAQLVNGEWWAPVFGCNSLESALARIRERLQRHAAPVPVAVDERTKRIEDLAADAVGALSPARSDPPVSQGRFPHSADYLQQFTGSVH